MPAGGSTVGAPCCRLAASHRPAVRAARYPTDARWAERDPLLPDPACLAGRGGRWEKPCRRVIVDAIPYVVGNGIKWRALPVDFPPWTTVYQRFAARKKVGASQRLLDAVRDRVRLVEGRRGLPIGARRRHRREGHPRLGRREEGRGPQAAHRRGHPGPAGGGVGDPGLDAGPGRRPQPAAPDARHRRETLPHFTVLPRRWAVERTLAWVTGHRRCVRDDERLPRHHEAMVRWSMIRITSRRLTQSQ
nr:transposase [Saccharothrix syringae]